MATKREKNYMTFRRPRTRTIKALNNIYAINTISRQALADYRGSLQTISLSKIGFDIPVISGERVVVARRKSKIFQLVDEAIKCDLYKQALVSAVIVVEDYLIQMLDIILKWYPEKLAIAERKIDISMVVEAENLDEVLHKIIEKQINSTFYTSPSKYFQYIEHTLAIKLPTDVKASYIEYKASRDVLIHNSGIANSTYIRKAGKLARVKAGEEILIDESYFNDFIRGMKRLVVAVYKQLLGKYGSV